MENTTHPSPQATGFFVEETDGRAWQGVLLSGPELVWAARPGCRVWRADSLGRVTSTAEFRSALENQEPATVAGVADVAGGPDRKGVEQQHEFCQLVAGLGVTVSHNEAGRVYLLDLAGAALLAWAELPLTILEIHPDPHCLLLLDTTGGLHFLTGRPSLPAPRPRSRSPGRTTAQLFPVARVGSAPHLTADFPDGLEDLVENTIQDSFEDCSEDSMEDSVIDTMECAVKDIFECKADSFGSNPELHTNEDWAEVYAGLETCGEVAGLTELLPGQQVGQVDLLGDSLTNGLGRLLDGGARLLADLGRAPSPGPRHRAAQQIAKTAGDLLTAEKEGKAGLELTSRLATLILQEQQAELSDSESHVRRDKIIITWIRFIIGEARWGSRST